ncbi:extensin family protein [Hyphomicrobium sp.]|uniref:extensin family protein n=1 Tax=Hyphomicrobium sp. TaxID=82 RepID=UPI0025B9CCC8|nr:extensin family protein [Hyphomicrobium sp.]
MTTSPSAGHDTRPSRLRKIATTAIFVASLLVGEMPADAQAKQKAKHPAAEATSTAEPASQAPPAQAASDAAKANPAAQKPEDGGKPADPAKTAAEPAPKAPPTWSAAEIADAKAHCAVVLKRIHAVAMPHEPIKEGACGTPAPIELISIGQNPQVALSPPAIVTCDLAESLVNWFEGDVQPLARKHLKSEIITIQTMSSYSCRNAYGRKKTKLSEHGLANALDIGGFVTASTKTADVLQDWGKPQRQILAEAAAEQRAAEEAAAKAAGTAIAANPAQAALASALPSTAGAAVTSLARSTIIDGVGDAEIVATPTLATSDPVVANKLGGPLVKPAKKGSSVQKTSQVGARSTSNPDPEIKAFLREAHTAACRIFGTTLGPEANEDHRNHFHIDMAQRKFTKICD